MAAPYLGGFRIVAASWASASSIRVDFVSTYGSLYQYQLYAGRSLIGATTSTDERRIIAPLSWSLWPQVLAIVAIDPSTAGTDYGSTLPPRPYNKAIVNVATSGWPSDSRLVAIAWGDSPGGAVNYSNEVRTLYDTDRTYQLTSLPTGPSGSYNFAAYGIDDKPVDGNRGTVTSLTADLLTMPPDLVVTDGARFTATATSGTATITYEYAGT